MIKTNPRKLLIGGLSAVLLAACQDKPTTPPPAPKTSVFDPQLKALEKAKGVESVVKQQADEQRRQLEAAEK